jgi:hypothetical protein
MKIRLYFHRMMCEMQVQMNMSMSPGLNETAIHCYANVK